MAATYPFKITTMLGVAFEGTIESVTAPAVEGQVGILAGHAPMICATRAGKITVREAGGREMTFEVDEGTLEVKESSAVLLTGYANPVR